MNDELITILMPIYDRESFFEEAIESVLGQTVPYWRLIITIDTMTPKPEIVKICERNTDQRISIILNQHKNQCSALNKAVKHVTTPYCSRLDSDDRLAPNAIETMTRNVRACPDVGYFYTSLLPIDENGVMTGDIEGFKAEEFSRTRLEEWYITRHLVTFKVRDFAIVGGYDEDITYAEDYLFALSAMIHGTNFMAIKDPLYLYRTHDKGQLTNIGGDIQIVREKYAALKKELGVSLAGEDPSIIRPLQPNRY